MVKKRVEDTLRFQNLANVLSVSMIFIISAIYFLEAWLAGITVNALLVGFLIIFVFLLTIGLMAKNKKKFERLGFKVPGLLYLFYIVFLFLCKGTPSHYLLACLIFCGISNLYSDFGRSVTFIVSINTATLALLFLGAPIFGNGEHLLVTLVNWGMFFTVSLVMLLFTRFATVILNRVLEHRNSFWELLDTTENYVAMIDQRNEIVYASKTMAQLSNVDEPALVNGRPIVDLFPGKSLKAYIGKMLNEKDMHSADWEFFLNGQKRFFRAVSNNLRSGNGSLINLYDMTHLAERDEITVMKDSMKIGLFFMDSNFIIQDHYSRYLEELLSESELFGKNFTDVISDSVAGNELGAIKDYFKMVLERAYDQEMLEEINPLSELRYVNAKTGDRKVLQCAFSTIERDRGEVFLLVTVYDITIRVELEQKLKEEEARRQEEMQSVFELIQVEPNVINDFIEDMEHEFGNIYDTLKNDILSTHDALVKIYQSVHAIKSNAVILGLNVFGNKLHTLESKIKILREMEAAVPFAEMLNLTMDVDKISKESDRFKDILAKIQSYGSTIGGGNQDVKVMLESLSKCAHRSAEDMDKRVKFISDDIDAEAVHRGPRRVIKEILMQLIRNSAVHGIESADVRKKKGKNDTGVIKLSIKMAGDYQNINLRLSDDGGGLDYRKIAEKAVTNKLIRKEDANNIELLKKAIFMPGFSTAETEGLHAGRGIGLNLVRDRVKEVGGKIKLHSETDKGVIFFVSVPVPLNQRRKS